LKFLDVEWFTTTVPPAAGAAARGACIGIVLVQGETGDEALQPGENAAIVGAGHGWDAQADIDHIMAWGVIMRADRAAQIFAHFLTLPGRADGVLSKAQIVRLFNWRPPPGSWQPPPLWQPQPPPPPV
jgi:hypothetical protein